jgi:MscS family membrane protein
MSSFLRRSVVVFVLLVSGLPAAAQGSLGQILQPSTSATPSGAAADQLGRETPNGATFGFLQAAQSGNYSIAAQYLQLSPARRQAQGEELATKLKVVMDRALAGSLKNISTRSEGTVQEGVPLDRQKLGTMSSGDVEVDLDLVRVTDPVAGTIWLVSSETLAKLPELYDQVEARQVETRLPRVLVKNVILGMPVWQWLSLLLAIPVAAGIGWLVLMLVELPLRWWSRFRGQPPLSRWRSVAAPVWLLAGTAAHRILVVYLGLPLLPRHYYFQIATVVVIIGFTWILWRALRKFLYGLRTRALAHGRAGTGSLILLGERLAKLMLFVAAVLTILGILGFNLTTALAGLGIGGLAIGFGAQKTIENLFGGVSVLGDEVIRVGDVCRFGDRTGTVEDIGLRSTRVRTDDRTLLAIPNGTVATINVENLSCRDKILFKTNLGMRCETSADQMRYVLSEIRRLLFSHPKVESSTVRVRLTDFLPSSLNIELVSYILTRDYNEFAAVREDLLLRIMDLVTQSGTGLAFPSQTLYLGRDAGLQNENTDAALKHVQTLREEKQLPFPDFTPEDIASFRDSIVYPPPDSPARSDK